MIIFCVVPLWPALLCRTQFPLTFAVSCVWEAGTSGNEAIGDGTLGVYPINRKAQNTFMDNVFIKGAQFLSKPSEATLLA